MSKVKSFSAFGFTFLLAVGAFAGACLEQFVPATIPKAEYPIAVIDIGSASAKMTIYLPNGKTVKQVFWVTLGKSLAATNSISKEAETGLVEALRGVASACDSNGVSPANRIFWATAGLRDATNGKQVVERTGVPIRILSGIEEATLVYRSIVFGERQDQLLAALEIGAGSTEIIVGRGGNNVDPTATAIVSSGSSRISIDPLDTLSIQNAQKSVRQFMEAEIPQLTRQKIRNQKLLMHRSRAFTFLRDKMLKLTGKDIFAEGLTPESMDHFLSNDGIRQLYQLSAETDIQPLLIPLLSKLVFQREIIRVLGVDRVYFSKADVSMTDVAFADLVSSRQGQ